MNILLKHTIFVLLTVQAIYCKPTIENDNIVFPIENEILDSDDSFEIEGQNIATDNVNTSLEMGNFFQGDIKLLPEQKELFLSQDDLVSRTGLLLKHQRWPSSEEGFIIVPFTFPKSSDYCKFIYVYEMDPKVA